MIANRTYAFHWYRLRRINRGKVILVLTDNKKGGVSLLRLGISL